MLSTDKALSCQRGVAIDLALLTQRLRGPYPFDKPLRNRHIRKLKPDRVTKTLTPAPPPIASGCVTTAFARKGQSRIRRNWPETRLRSAVYNKEKTRTARSHPPIYLMSSSHCAQLGVLRPLAGKRYKVISWRRRTEGGGRQ